MDVLKGYKNFKRNLGFLEHETSIKSEQFSYEDHEKIIEIWNALNPFLLMNMDPNDILKGRFWSEYKLYLSVVINIVDDILT